MGPSVLRHATEEGALTHRTDRSLTRPSAKTPPWGCDETAGTTSARSDRSCRTRMMSEFWLLAFSGLDRSRPSDASERRRILQLRAHDAREVETSYLWRVVVVSPQKRETPKRVGLGRCLQKKQKLAIICRDRLRGQPPVPSPAGGRDRVAVVFAVHSTARASLAD